MILRFWEEKGIGLRLFDDGHQSGSVSFEITIKPESPLAFVDNAMEMKGPAKLFKSGPGGIDLTRANINLQTQNAGEAIKFRLDPAQLAQLQNTIGFVPVIINIQPMRDLRKFLVG